MFQSKIARKRQDDIFKAFEGYIQKQDFFDIIFSKKFGYVCLFKDGGRIAGTALIDTPEKMLDTLFNDVVTNIIGTNETGGSKRLTESERAQAHRLLVGILETIEDEKEFYIRYLNTFFASCADGSPLEP